MGWGWAAAVGWGWEAQEEVSLAAVVGWGWAAQVEAGWAVQADLGSAAVMGWGPEGVVGSAKAEEEHGDCVATVDSASRAAGDAAADGCAVSAAVG